MAFNDGVPTSPDPVTFAVTQALKYGLKELGIPASPLEAVTKLFGSFKSKHNATQWVGIKLPGDAEEKVPYLKQQGITSNPRIIPRNRYWDQAWHEGIDPLVRAGDNTQKRLESLIRLYPDLKEVSDTLRNSRNHMLEVSSSPQDAMGRAQGYTNALYTAESAINDFLGDESVQRDIQEKTGMPFDDFKASFDLASDKLAMANSLEHVLNPQLSRQTEKLTRHEYGGRGGGTQKPSELDKIIKKGVEDKYTPIIQGGGRGPNNKQIITGYHERVPLPGQTTRGGQQKYGKGKQISPEEYNRIIDDAKEEAYELYTGDAKRAIQDAQALIEKTPSFGDTQYFNPFSPDWTPQPRPQQGQGLGIKEEQNRQLVNDLFEENPWMEDVYGGADNVHLVDSSKDPERLKSNTGGGGIEFYPESEPGLPEIPNPDFGKKTRLEIFSEDLANDPEALKSAVYLDLFHGITTHPKFKPYTDQIKNSFTPKQKAWHDEQALELGIDINSPEDMDAFYDRVVTPKYLRGAFNILPDNSLGELAGYAKGFRGPNELWPGHSTDLYTQEQRSIIGELSEVLGQKSLQPGLLGDAFIPGEATAPSPDIHVVDPRDSNDLRYDPGMPDVQELTPQPDTTTPDLGTTDTSPFTGDTSPTSTSTFSEEARKAVEGWERELEAYESSLTPERIAEIRGEIDRGGITTDPNKKGFGIPTSTLLGIAALGTGLLTGGGSGSNTTDTETPETPRRLDIELPPSTQFSGLVGSSNTSPYNTPYTEEVLQGNIKPQKLAMMSELELPFRDERAYPFTNRPDTTPIFGLL